MTFWLCVVSKISLLSSAHQSAGALVTHLPNVHISNSCHPCSIFLNVVVSREPLLMRNPSCGRCVGSKPLQQVPPDEAWSSVLCAWTGVGVGEAVGSHWPDIRVHHTRCLAGDSDVNSRLVQNYTKPFFFSDTLGSKRLMNGSMLEQL